MILNPRLANEFTRATDRTLSNIETHPEGFNQLRRLYSSLNSPTDVSFTFVDLPGLIAPVGGINWLVYSS